MQVSIRISLSSHLASLAIFLIIYYQSNGHYWDSLPSSVSVSFFMEALCPAQSPHSYIFPHNPHIMLYVWISIILTTYHNAYVYLNHHNLTYIYYITLSGFHNICANIHDSSYHILNQLIHILIISIYYSELQFTFLANNAYQFIPHQVACTYRC